MADEGAVVKDLEIGGLEHGEIDNIHVIDADVAEERVDYAASIEMTGIMKTVDEDFKLKDYGGLEDIQTANSNEIQNNDANMVDTFNGPWVEVNNDANMVDTFEGPRVEVNNDANMVDPFDDANTVDTFEGPRVEVNNDAMVDPFEGPWVEVNNDANMVDTFEGPRVEVNNDANMVDLFDGPWVKRRRLDGKFGNSDTKEDQKDLPNFFRMIWRKPFLLGIGFSGSLSGLMIGLFRGLEQQDDLSDDEKKKNLIINVVCSCVGAPFGALISDLWGRKPALTISDAIYFLGWGIMIFSGQPLLTRFGQFVIATNVAFCTLASFLYLAEISPPELRGKMIGLVGFFTACGLLISYIVTNMKIWDEHQFFFKVAAWFLPLVQAVFLFWMPESALFFIKKKKILQAFKSLSTVHPEEEAKRILNKLVSVPPKSNEEKLYLNWIFAFKSKVVRVRVLGGIFLQIFSQLAGFIIVSYLKTFLFRRAGLSETLQEVGSILLDIAGAAGSFIIIDSIERKKLLLYSSLILALNLFGLGIYVRSVLKGEVAPGLVLLFAVPLMANFEIIFYAGLDNLSWVINCESHSTEFRAVGMAFAAIARFLANLVATVTLVPLKDWHGEWSVCIIYGVLCVVGSLAIFIFFPKKRALNLEDFDAVQ